MMPTQKPGKSKQDYQTPPEFLNAVRKLLNIGNFKRDLAASTNNISAWYFTEADDALSKSWQGFNDGWQWLNPPFSKIKPWVAKASGESRMGAQIAVLIPASVGSNWWYNHVHGEAHVLFLRNRITFVGAKDPYPKDLALLLYRPNLRGGNSFWDWRKA